MTEYELVIPVRIRAMSGDRPNTRVMARQPIGTPQDIVVTVRASSELSALAQFTTAVQLLAASLEPKG